MAYDPSKPPSATNLPPGLTWNAAENPLSGGPGAQSKDIANLILAFYNDPRNGVAADTEGEGWDDTDAKATQRARANAMAAAGYRENTNAGTYNGRYDSDIKSMWDAQQLPYVMAGNWIAPSGGAAKAPHALDAGAGNGLDAYMPQIIMALGAAGLGAGALGLGSTTPITGTLAGEALAGSGGVGSLVGGTAADTLGAGTLPTWAGGVAEGGGVTGSSLGASSLAGQGLTTTAGVGSTFAGGAGAAGAGGINAGGGGMWDWLDNLINSGADNAGGIPTGGPDPYAGLNYSAQDIQSLMNGTYSGAEQTAGQSAGQLGSNYGLTQMGGYLQQLSDMGVPFDLLQRIGNLPNLPTTMGGSNSGPPRGNANSSGLSQLLQSLGLPSGLSGVIGGAAATAPILATMNYARNQTPADTGQLQGLFNQYSPDAQAGTYDLQSASGRNQLNSSLTNRGVSGSSFGNFDLASYDTLRGLGRSQLVNQGVSTQAGIAGQILAGNLQSQSIKNNLLGSGLNALGLAARGPLP